MKKSSLLLALFVLFAVACGDDDTSKAPNLTLASLTVSNVALTPAFDPAVTAYTVSVSNTVEQITVTGIASDANATVVVDPESPSELKSGSNLVMVWVFSADGSAFKVYRVTINKEVSANANLSSLIISAGALVPAFDPAVTNYSISGYVANVLNTTMILAAQQHVGATLSYPGGQIPALIVGSNQLVVRVTAEDGTTTKDYTIRIYRMGADYTSANIGILKYVPAGFFQRDATATNTSYVSAFRISQTEITRTQFNAVMGADPSQTGYSSGTGDPVQLVNWYHAIAFCNKLSIRDRLGQVYSVSGVNFGTLTFANIPVTNNAIWNAATANWTATGYRLPTEMEWQWAAMGANMGADPFAVNTTGYTKAFAGSTEGNSIGDYAWYFSNSGGYSHPAGSKLPNELGLSDMSGNVWEWCWDWYGVCPAGFHEDYRGADLGTQRIFRGGAYHLDSSLCALNYQGVAAPNYNSHTFGIRVVRP